MDIDLELEHAVELIIKEKAKRVCIQLPDGLKPRAGEISDFLASKTSAEIIIWAGSCFGACDVPYEIQSLGIDLLIQWGHNELLWDRAEACAGDVK